MPDTLNVLPPDALTDDQLDAEIARHFKAADKHLAGYWSEVFQLVHKMRIKRQRLGYGNWIEWKRNELPKMGVSVARVEKWMTEIDRIEKFAAHLIPHLPKMSEAAVMRQANEACWRVQGRRRPAKPKEKLQEKGASAPNPLADASKEIFYLLQWVGEVVAHIATQYPEDYEPWLKRLPITRMTAEICRTMFEKPRQGVAEGRMQQWLVGYDDEAEVEIHNAIMNLGEEA